MTDKTQDAGASVGDTIKALKKRLAEQDEAGMAVNRLGRSMGIVPGIAQCFGDVIDEAIKRCAERDTAHAAGYAQGVRHVADRLRIMGNMGGQAIALALLTADTPAPSQENSHD